MSKIYQYKWNEQSTQFGFENYSNRKMLFTILHNRLGNNYVQWEQHPDYIFVCTEIHEKAFGLSPTTYKKNGGITNQVRYLSGAFRHSDKHSCRNIDQKGPVGDNYRRAIKDAIEAHVIDPRFIILEICDSDSNT